jgi:hypothetical protein
VKRLRVTSWILLPIALVSATLFALWSGTSSSSAKSTGTSSLGATVVQSSLPNQAGVSSSPSATGNAAVGTVPTTLPANVTGTSGTIYSGLASLVSGKMNDVHLGPAIPQSDVTNFVQAYSPILATTQIVPTLESSSNNADGSVSVEFTVKVLVHGAVFPTSIGTVSATIGTDGVLSLGVPALCQLVSPITPTCPF